MNGEASECHGSFQRFVSPPSQTLPHSSRLTSRLTPFPSLHLSAQGLSVRRDRMSDHAAGDM